VKNLAVKLHSTINIKVAICCGTPIFDDPQTKFLSFLLKKGFHIP
jgi:hypothetical protein